MSSKPALKLNFNKNDWTAVLLYAASVIIALLQLKEILYIYIHNKGSIVYNPYLFTLYILFPVLAFMTVTTSSLIKVAKLKFKYIAFSYICLAFIIFGMVTQYSNELIWRFIMSAGTKMNRVPDEILESAIRAATFYVPIIATSFTTGIFAIFITDREGRAYIPLMTYSFFPKSIVPTGALTCEMPVCIDIKTNKPIVIPEAKRMEATLIQGATGTGKTATLLLPMGAVDIERKYFFKELAKEQGHKALEKGYAYVDAPLSNEELNRNFTLRFLKPLKGKETLFETELKDLIRYKDPKTGEILFSDLGLGAVDPDGEYVKVLRNIAKNFGIDCIIVDPMHEETVGINPFIGYDPAKIASIISTVLKGMYESENPGDSNLFFAQVTQQAIENLAILLKLIYPRMHGGMIPTLEDMLELLHNYDLVEEMCEELKKDPALTEEYIILIDYFEKNFYKPIVNDRGIPLPGSVGSGRRVTEQFLYGATTQLDNLLRQKDVKKVLCSRSNNIDYDDILASGKCLTVCSRRGPLGSLLSKAFGMFFILSLQDAVLRRPGNEKTRVPFFLYIDEFPDFVNKETETCFTLFRKYRCGLIVAIQNLSQLERTQSMAYYKNVVLANTKTQLIFGDTNVEDSEYWSEALGRYVKWTSSIGYSGGPDGYSESQSQGFTWDALHPPNTIHYQGFKRLKYKAKTSAGKTIVGDGKTNFVDAKYFVAHPVKFYNFEKFKINSPYSEPDHEPAPQYDSISTSFSQVAAEETPSAPPPKAEPVVRTHEEPKIALGDNIRSELNDDNLSAEEKNALKELITEIHSDEELHVEEPSIEIGMTMMGVQPVPGVVDVQPVEDEDKVENPDVLDKTGKIKIEVKQD